MKFMFSLFLIFVCFVSDLYAKDKIINGKVIKVIDGDTIIVKYKKIILATEDKIRFHAIDAPELNQIYGKEAREFCKKLCFGQDVKIKIRDKDKYGRIIAEVYLKDGTFVNEEMVKNGYAWWYRYHAPNSKILEKAEKIARKNNFGLWKEKNQEPPWLWRKKNDKDWYKK